MAARAKARTMILLATIQGLAGFQAPAVLKLGLHRFMSPALPSPCTLGRIVHPRSLLRNQLNIHDTTHKQAKFVSNSNGDAAREEYSPRAGEQALRVETTTPPKSKVHLMGPTQYLGALKKVAADFETLGLRAVWVGGGQDTFYQALAVQLHNAGIDRPVGSTGSTSAPNGYDFTPAQDALRGTFPAACRQIRLDIVRCIISNIERLGQFTVGAERDIHAAAMRFQVRIVCLEVSDDGRVKRNEYHPQEGVDARVDLFLCRKGEHFVSARALQGSKGGAGGAGGGDGTFCNIKDDDVLYEMRDKAQYMGLRFEEPGDSEAPGTQELPKRATADGEVTDAEVYTWADGPPRDVRGGRRLLREVVQTNGGVTLDMPEKHYSTGGNNFFNSFAAELQRAGIPLKSKVVSAGSHGVGAALDIESAARIARSEVIMYSNAHAATYAHMPSPIKELAVAACKFNVKITCFDLVKGVVSKNAYLPKDGVVARGELILGRDGDRFWSALPSHALIEPAAVPLQTADIMEIPAGAEIPVGYEDEDEAVSPSSVSPIESVLDAADEDEDARESQDKSVVFDKKTLSWKMMTKEEQAKVQAEFAASQPAPDPMAGKSGNYLPRFSKFKNANSEAPPSSKATVADAMLAGQISSRNGKINIDTVALANRRASAGITNEVQVSDGMLQLEAKLAEQGKVIDLNQGGGNAYLVIAELMYTHKLEIQGLMFTMWGEERRNSLVGAMSRKAREDVKTYMYHNPDVFEKAGQWVGDHDCLAMARCYKVRIVVSRVIYDDQIEECVYEPEPGVKPRGELHVILDRKIFWAVKTLEAFEKQVAGDEEDSEEEEVEVVKKPRSALEKVLAKYGKNEEEEVQEVAKIVPKKSDKGEKSIIGFRDVHTVKAVRDHSATVIWLHGLGEQATEWTALPEALHMPWAKFIFPASHAVALDLWDGKETNAWFDLSPAAYQVHSNSMNAVPEIISRIYSKIQPDLDKIETSAALVQELVRKEIKNGISPENIILAGFSQGATIALHAALSMEEKIGGVVALSMWHLPSITGAEAAESSRRDGKLPVLFCHGANDRVITADFAEHMCSEMASALDVNYLQFDDLAHGICADELSAVRRFLLSQIPGQAKYDSLNALPATYRRRDGVAKSNAKMWGDGSEAVTADDQAALDAMVEEAVRNNLDEFASSFVDSGSSLWVDLRQTIHDKSKSRKLQQRK